jgi:hypothetical protein
MSATPAETTSEILELPEQVDDLTPEIAAPLPSESDHVQQQQHGFVNNRGNSISVKPTVARMPPPPPSDLPPSLLLQQLQLQQQPPLQRPPLTVYAVIGTDGSILAMHRSVKAASVDAWTRALSTLACALPYKVEGWQVAFGDTVETLRVAGWALNVSAALTWKRAPNVSAWLEELSETNRVPKALWISFMTQY